MPLHSRTLAPKWSPQAVPGKAGWYDPFSGELLVAFAGPAPVIPKTAATITDVRIGKKNVKKVYKTGDVIDVCVTFNKRVFVTGANPRFPMTLNGSTVYATYNHGSGSPRLHFNYVVQSGDVYTAGQVQFGIAAVAAGRTLGSGNSAVTAVAVTPGTAGNSITVAFVNPGTNNAALGVVVASSAITVNLATNGSAAATSTVAQVLAALAASAPAAALITATTAGNGTGVVVAVTATNLAGGTAASTNTIDLNTTGHIYDLVNFATLTLGASNSQIVFSALKPGTYGNAVSVAVVNPGTNSAALSVSLSGNAVTISLATNGSAVATSTVNQVLSALAANADVSNLVTATFGSGNGTGLLAAASVTSLAGGIVGASTQAAVLTFTPISTATVTLN